jgi:hypothetical protein
MTKTIMAIMDLAQSDVVVPAHILACLMVAYRLTVPYRHPAGLGH